MTAGRRRTLVSFSMDATGMVFDMTFGPEQVHMGVAFAKECVCSCKHNIIERALNTSVLLVCKLTGPHYVNVRVEFTANVLQVL